MQNNKVGEAISLLDMLSNESSIPKNIRKALSDAKQRLESNEELNVKVSAAVYIIDSISDDINMPAHARTQIWGVVSMLESMKI
ncbi:TPA: hypothetical protein HA238_01410 [Candidatus Micrarchaeota archaeon]|nr:hypothetical protein [Candidatus Micrarchaeota archaeon]